MGQEPKMADSSGVLAAPTPLFPVDPLTLDTTAGSVLHIIPRVLNRCGLGGLVPVVLYAGALSLSLLPLIACTCLNPLYPLPLTVQSDADTLKMPFLYDANTIFLFLVSFPCLLILAVTDDRQLSRALHRVQFEGVITISEESGAALAKRWYQVFRTFNAAVQVFSLGAGAVVAHFVFERVSTETGSWFAYDNHVLLAGYVFVYCNFLLTVVTSIYVLRCFAVAMLLRSIVRHAELHILPLHPDKAGGLQPIGHIALRNQYALTLLGINVALGLALTLLLSNRNNEMIGLVAAAATAYLILGPFVFVAPLLPFSEVMTKNKAQMMSEVALRMRAELDNIRLRFQSGAITAEDEQSIERLRKIGAVIDELPVWPFDAGTLRKFSTAYLIPILGSVALGLGKVAVLHYFPSLK
jgi:hypothetical protein